MSKLEYSAECICGGEIVTRFKKPTRFQPSISRVLCRGCKSEFMFSYSVEYSGGKRAYVPKYEMSHVTPKLSKAIKDKREQIKETTGVGDVAR